MPAPNFITLTGNLTSDPEPRMTSGEVPMTRLRIAVNRRTFNAEANAWEARQDGFFTVVCWRETARNVAASLRKGDRVVVTGRLQHREYEATVGSGTPERRSVVEVEADEIGPSLRWAAWGRMEVRAPADTADTAIAAAVSTDGEEDVTAAA